MSYSEKCTAEDYFFAVCIMLFIIWSNFFDSKIKLHFDKGVFVYLFNLDYLAQLIINFNKLVLELLPFLFFRNIRVRKCNVICTSNFIFSFLWELIIIFLELIYFYTRSNCPSFLCMKYFKTDAKHILF